MFRLAEIGHAGVPRDQISPGLRMIVLARYRVYFRVTETETRIVRFLHAARNIDPIGFDDPT